MNRGQLVQVNGKKEKGVNGRVIVKKADDEEDAKFLKKTVQFYSGQKGLVYEVQGKCNTVQIMDSVDCVLEVDTVVSGVEVTNSKGVTLRVKDDKEFWTCTVNKTSNLVIELNDAIAKGGVEFIETKQAVAKKEFQVIGAAISNVTVKRNGKNLLLPSKFTFKPDVSKPEAEMTTSPYTGNFDKTTKGIELTADGDGFSTSKAKGKTVYISKKIGKKDAVQLEVKDTANVVVLDECKKVQLTVGSVQKEIQVYGCKQVKITVKKGGKVPRIVLDNSHGCYVTLEDFNAEFSVVAQHYSDLNVNFPFGGDGAQKELSMPEQFVYKFENDTPTYELPTF